MKALLEVRPGLALAQCPGASAFLGRSTQLSSDRRDAADAVGHEWVRASADRAQLIASGAGEVGAGGRESATWVPRIRDKAAVFAGQG